MDRSKDPLLQPLRLVNPQPVLAGSSMEEAQTEASELPPRVQAPQIDPLTQFGQGFQRPDMPALYQVALAFVTAAMVLLPLIYLSLVGLSIYGTYYHATEHYGPLFLESRGRIWWSLFLFFTPLLSGVTISFFMIKPLFAPRVESAEPCSPTRQSEPQLYAFVEKVCDIVGAPRPSKIYLDSQVNASASFRRGFLSLFGNDLALTIGLPLAGGLTMRQLAGVLAHEFGHFTQASGMRLTYIIRSINHWFARVVYERDEWDARLEDLAEVGDVRVQVMANLARLAVWCSRQILRVLMILGHLISSFALRQMEFHADSFETRMAGSECFEQTARRLAVLNQATGETYEKLQEFYQNAHLLPQDLPSAVLCRAASLPESTLAEVDAELSESKTSIFDTHPSDAERIRRSWDESAEGIFHLDLDATQLFENFEFFARIATERHYEVELGRPIPEAHLISAEVFNRALDQA